ncbi:MAG: acetate--CoA ligase family protein, partial [Anaerolineales bacterium]|nr:acetate--CoA ligase family protein [Anaerolineales bacterium]
VVIGASTHPEKLGYGVARNLIQSGYRGAVCFVNPKGGNLFTRFIYKSVIEVPDPVDLAVLIVPAPVAAESLRLCGERGIHAVILISSGFREAGPIGVALETNVLQIARQYGIRLLGPNCIGLMDTHLPLDTTFLPPPSPRPGEIAFISHSGAICAAIIDWSLRQGFGFSRLISLGNQADVNETDMLIHTMLDEYTRVLTLYLESVADGQRFIDETRRVNRQKPVVVLKVGRSAGGQRAAASHTGALTGVDTAYSAAFEKAGIFRADSIEEMFDWARALAWSPLPRGRRMAVLTNAGGPGVIAADSLENEGLQLADLSPETCTALTALLPSAASLRNPIDMLASASSIQYASCLRLLLDDPCVDGVLLILPPPPMYPAVSVAEALIPIICNASKPVVVALMGSTQIDVAAERFQAAHVPEYRFPERAAAVLARLTERAEFLSKPEQPAQVFMDIDTDKARSLLTEDPIGSWLAPEAAEGLLRAYGIPVASIKLAHNTGEAIEISQELGYPIALKIASHDISHKSDVGGILLGIDSPESAAEGFRTIQDQVRKAKPEADIEGVYIQRMIPQGQDVIVGAVHDLKFGALMMFGSGGVEVEGLKDVAFALAPLAIDEAERLILKTWAGRKLTGFRNNPPVDLEAVKETLQRLAQLASDFPKISEIEINPLRVFEKGAVALDVRVKI